MTYMYMYLLDESAIHVPTNLHQKQYHILISIVMMCHVTVVIIVMVFHVTVVVIVIHISIMTIITLSHDCMKKCWHNEVFIVTTICILYVHGYHHY